MKTKQIRFNNFILPLRLKIASGYILLIVLLGMIVFVVWKGNQQVISLNAAERIVQEKRTIINRIFEQLLNLSFSDDLLLSGDTAALASYRTKRFEAVATLNMLKIYYPTSEQQVRIDSVCMLLEEKEQHLCKVQETLSAQDETDELIRKRIPDFALQVQRENTPTPKKKGGLLGLFRKKQKDIPPPLMDKTSAMLYSFGREVEAKQEKFQRQLKIYTDSLRQRNIELNGKLSKIIHEFEADAMLKMKWEHEHIIGEREHLFRIISIAAVMAVLLVIVFYIVIHRDITHKFIYRKELETSDRRNRELLTARRNLILTVSHDLRAPLGTISEYAQLLQDEKSLKQCKGYATNILHASQHVIGLANNLLYYYRLEAEKEQPEKEIFHPGRTVEDTARSFLPMAERKGLGLTTEVTDSDILVEGDCRRLVQILNNLLSNAIKFTRAGYIHIGAQYHAGKLSFFVRDTGIGIDKEKQEQIFTAFERGEAPGAEQGFGLGLAITYKLVTLLQGTIRLQSTPGHGSTFEVCLPMPETEGLADMTKRFPECGELSGMRILAIDDDRMQLDVTQKMYARYGIECDCCLNVGELVAALRHNRYDLVLTDMRMPEMDGYEVLVLLRSSNLQQTKTIPVLAVTAQAGAKPEHFKHAGFAGCLHKPFSPEELMSVTSRIDRTNFTAIMEGEENINEMLGMFIEDTEKELSEMRDALGMVDYMRLKHIIHKAAPLWGMIRINVSLRELEELASLSSEKWCKELDGRIKILMEAVVHAVKKAKELKEEPDENHISSRG